MTQSKSERDCENNFEKEINILDYAIVVLKHKRMILFAIIIAFVIVNVVLYVKWQRNQSTNADDVAECTIYPLVSKDLFNSVVRSSLVIDGVLRSKDAMAFLYPHLWDNKEKKRTANNMPSQEEAYNKLKHAISTKWDDKVVILSITGSGGDNMKTLLSIYVKEIDKYALMKHLDELDFQKEAMNELLLLTTEDSNNPIRKETQKISPKYITALNLEKKRLKNKNTVISVIDIPHLVKTVKADSSFISQSYFKIVFISLFIALIISIMLAFFLEYLHDLRNKYPDKVSDLKKLLK